MLTVLAGDSGTGLFAATIKIFRGTELITETAADESGLASVDLPPGDYEIELSSDGYAPQTRRATVVASQQVSRLAELSLASEEALGETIEVTDTVDTRQDSPILAERRAAPVVTDAVSAQQISRSPDSSASDAAKRVVGATVQDSRYVVIRGLGGRYSLTLLNGVPVPSPDPDIPAAPLDVFPASLITNLTVSKTASPSLPGAFAGGALTIDTRSYPRERTVKAKVGLGLDSAGSLREISGYTGGGLDFLGFDDGARALPSSISSSRLASSTQTGAFQNNTWELSSSTSLPNLSLSASLADTARISGQRLGYLTALSYGYNTTSREAKIARVGEPDGNGGYLPSVLQLEEEQGLRRANLSALATTSAALAEGHQLGALVLYTHSGENSASVVTGTDNSTAQVERTRLRFVERTLAFGQLVGRHDLSRERLQLDWQGNVALVGQDEPDTRDLLRTQTPEGLVIDYGSGSAERLFGELSDLSGGGGFGLTWRTGGLSNVQAGASLQASARDYQTRRFHFDLTSALARMAPEDAFDPRNAASGMSLRETTVPTDGYQANRTIAAGYAMADMALGAKIRLVGGLRVEHSALNVGLAKNLDFMATLPPDTDKSDTAVLPSVNAVYSVSDRSNLRAAASATVARANFREIAPALYYDYVRRRAIGGNADLEETRIYNADLRWETYLDQTSGILAASLFAKRFDEPIEQVLEAAGDGQNISFRNADSATSYGVELEARVPLRTLASALAPLSFTGNLSLIGSSVDVGGGSSRALQGQSWYVLNLGLGYQPRAGTRADVLFNSSGRRIEEVGTGGAGDVYEEPFHRLDLAVSQKLGRDLTFKLAGSNLLGQRSVRTQNGVEIYSYTVGVVGAASLELDLD